MRPLDRQTLTLGLPMTTGAHKEIDPFMALYPQSAQRRPSVACIPVPYAPPGREPGKPGGRGE